MRILKWYATKTRADAGFAKDAASFVDAQIDSPNLRIKLPCGIEIDYVGGEPDRIKGHEFQAAWVDEWVSMDDTALVQSRIRP